jgi:Ran GTPase-activating protein (RanGAP) involved in mRNA processing and transport
MQLSNNNLQDYGVEFLAEFLRNPRIKLEHLTIYNNNIGDEGAIMLAEALYNNDYIKVINLQMNFIRDLGASYFIDGVTQSAFKSI